MHRALENSSSADKEDKLCSGRQETGITAEITVQSLSEESGGYTLDLDLDLTNRSDKGLRAITSFELVDDRGNIAVPGHIGPAIDLPEGAQASAGFTIPAGLAPGYYHLTATTVAGESANADHEDLITSYFVRVDDTGIVPISADDWHTMSNANEVFLLPEEEAP